MLLLSSPENIFTQPVTGPGTLQPVSPGPGLCARKRNQPYPADSEKSTVENISWCPNNIYTAGTKKQRNLGPSIQKGPADAMKSSWRTGYEVKTVGLRAGTASIMSGP